MKILLLLLICSQTLFATDYTWYKWKDHYLPSKSTAVPYTPEEAKQIADSAPEITAFTYFEKGAWVYDGGIDYATDYKLYKAGTVLFLRNTPPTHFEYLPGATVYFKVKNPYNPIHHYTANKYIDFFREYTGPFTDNAIHHSAHMSLDDAFEFADENPEVTHIISFEHRDIGLFMETSQDFDHNDVYNNRYYLNFHYGDRIFLSGSLPSWLTDSTFMNRIEGIAIYTKEGVDL